MSDTKNAAMKQALEALNGSQYRMNQYGYQAMETTIAANSEAITALRAALEQPNECQWQQDGDRDSGMYMASCNRRYFVFEDGTPSDNRMKHCCYCGKVLVEVLIEQEDDDE